MKKINLLSFALLLTLVGCASTNKPVSENSSNSVNEEVPYKILEINNPIKSISKKACPSTGKVKALVVPVHFSNDKTTAPNSNLVRSAFDTPLTSSLVPEWYSVKDFYQTSSYGKLEFDFTFTETYVPNNTSTYYGNKSNFNGDDYNTNGSRALYKEILEHFDDQYDYSEYDSDKDGVIDCIFMVYDHPVDYTYKNMFWWAYTSFYTGEDKFDNVSLGNYVWCGQDFFTKDNLNCNTQTIIHETSHLFGVDDYYKYPGTTGPEKGGLAGADLMDNDKGSPCGDHNSYTKSILGWTKPTVMVGDEATITINALQNAGDCIILANDFDFTKELYQEYFMLEYYTPTKLQERDKPFSTSGIRVLHVSSQLTSKGTFKYNNSNTTYRLISQITSKNGGTYINSSAARDDSTLFVPGESLTNVEFNSGDSLKYNFEVISEQNETCTIKITSKQK